MADLGSLEVGMKLHAKYTDGEFYPAEVLATSESKKRAKAPVKVHYVGYGDEEDAWVALDAVKSKKLKGSKGKAEPKAKAKAKAKVKAKAQRERKVPKIKLTYFAIEGVAEKIRLALTLGGIEFEDDRVPMDKWGEMKPTTQYGQLPMMQIGEGEPFSQSGAMLRWAGRMARLNPPSQLLRIEEIIGLEEDLGKAINPSLYVGMRPHIYGYPEDMAKPEKEKIQQALRKKLIADGGDIPRMLGYIEAFVKEDGFLCGDKPTIADCQVIPRLRHLKKGILDGIPTTIVDGFPKLSAYYDRFHELPKVKEYYEKLAAK